MHSYICCLESCCLLDFATLKSREVKLADCTGDFGCLNVIANCLQTCFGKVNTETVRVFNDVSICICRLIAFLSRTFSEANAFFRC